MQAQTRPLHTKKMLTPGLWELTLGSDPLPTPLQPGQFFLLRTENRVTAYLQRVIFPGFLPLPTFNKPVGMHLILATKDFKDAGLAWLGSRQAGEMITLLGPLGQGFTIPPTTKNLLLIGQDTTLTPLLDLAILGIKRNLNVVLALEATQKSNLYPVHNLPASIEFQLATWDGSQGHRGKIINYLGDLLPWADTICTIGDWSFYYQLKQQLQQTRLLLPQNLAQGLVLHPLLNVCGTGICTLCSTSTTSGPKLACTDGPVFDLAGLTFETG